MSEHASPAVPTSKPGKTRRPPSKPARIRNLGEGASAEAKRLAAAILEVLAGMRTPAGAAQVLKLSLPRYYQLEVRALHGMLAACEPRPLGRVKTSASALAALQRECEQWRRGGAQPPAVGGGHAGGHGLGGTAGEDRRVETAEAPTHGASAESGRWFT